MAKVENVPDILKALRGPALQHMDRLVAAGMEALLDALPVDSGHGHEAFITAISQADPGPQTQKVLNAYDSARSRDATAAQAGKGSLLVTNKKISFRVSVALPFLVVVDEGGTITVTGYRTGGTGTKKGGLATIGKLYARRRQFSGGRPGVLMWIENGKRRYARVRNIPAAGFMAAAYSAVKGEAE